MYICNGWILSEEHKLHLCFSLMEFPPLKYLSFFATLTILALIPLRVLLNKTDGFSNHSPQLQQILHTYLCFSLSYAFLFEPSLHLDRQDSGLVPPVWCYPYLNLILYFTYQYISDDIESHLIIFYVVIKLLLPSLLMTFCGFCYLLNTISDFYPYPAETISMSFFHWLVWVIFTASTNIVYNRDCIIKIEFDNPFFPYLVAPTMAYLLFLYRSKSQSTNPTVSIKVPVSTKIVVGIIGNILANHYIGGKSLFLFWLIVFFAIFLMGNIAMMHSTCHTTIFGFFVGVIVDVAGEIFGINIFMWLVGGCCAVVFVFVKQLDEFNRQYCGGHRMKEKVETSEV